MTNETDPILAFLRAVRDILRDPTGTTGDYNFGRTREALRKADADRLKHAGDFLSAFDLEAAVRADALGPQQRTDHDTADMSPRERWIHDSQDMWMDPKEKAFQDGHGAR